MKMEAIRVGKCFGLMVWHHRPRLGSRDGSANAGLVGRVSREAMGIWALHGDAPGGRVDGYDAGVHLQDRGARAEVHPRDVPVGIPEAARLCRVLREDSLGWPQRLRVAAPAAQGALRGGARSGLREHGLHGRGAVDEGGEAHGEPRLLSANVKGKAREVRVRAIGLLRRVPHQDVQIQTVLLPRPLGGVHEDTGFDAARAPAVAALIPGPPLHLAVNGIAIAVAPELGHVEGHLTVDADAVHGVAELGALVRRVGPPVAGHGELEHGTLAVGRREARQLEAAREDAPLLSHGDGAEPVRVRAAAQGAAGAALQRVLAEIRRAPLEPQPGARLHRAQAVATAVGLGPPAVRQQEGHAGALTALPRPAGCYCLARIVACLLATGRNCAV
mmetsp:Transcript_3328/g.9755  ORF Transcript_3328/g.9755 Transcript_3328/m.9755 type:complete len:388 (-) Transcript_3328:11-1174(-)